MTKRDDVEGPKKDKRRQLKTFDEKQKTMLKDQTRTKGGKLRHSMTKKDDFEGPKTDKGG